ncbi:MAG: hypothetical protein N2504_06380 [candidate division WOR-3 bacterium]|nr:hypothetical protein [candidate division WOR-3 bacterium]MCX7948195.1 hypothetical protein [candidate division WOR-3 bacterium]MDW8151108.1 hypothetical protein [candidate division WOR-3 bacterium]
MIKVLYVSFLLVLACKTEKKEPKDENENLIAKVGNIKITEEDLKIGLENLPGIELTKEQEESLKDELIRTSVFYLAAKDEKFDTSKTLNTKIEWIKRSIIASEYLKYKYGNRMPTESEINNFISSNISKFSKKVELIVIEFRDTLLSNQIRELLLDLNRTPVAGKRLDEMSRKGMILLQPIPSANLGILSFDFNDTIVNTILNSKNGSVLGPYKIRNSYGYIKIVNIAEDDPYKNELKQAVFQFLILQSQKRFMDSLYNVLKPKYIK